MVCAVLRVPLQEASWNRENLRVLYFTLEKGVDVMTGQDRTVLCAWDGETHVNYGDGPEATPEAFIERIEGMIETEGTGYGSPAH